MKVTKILKVVGIVVVVFFAALLIIPALFKDKVKDVIVSQVSSMLNAELYLGDFSLGFFSNFPHATLSVENFGIVNAEPFAGDTLVNVGELDVVINLGSLFSGNYEINKVALINPTAHVKVNADSIANWDIIKSDTTTVVEEETTEESSALSLSLNTVTVENLKVSYESVPDSMTATVDGLNLNLGGDIAMDLQTLVNIDELKLLIDKVVYHDNSSSDMVATLEKIDLDFNGAVSDHVSQLKLLLNVDSTSLSMGGIPYLTKAKVASDIKMEADLDNNKYTFGDNSVSLNEIVANFAGYVQLVDSTKTDMDLTLNTPSIDFKQILSLIPAIYANDFASIQTSGEVSLSATAKGRLEGDTLPTIDAKLAIANAMFKYPDLPGSVSDINIEANVTNPGGATDLTVVSVPKFSFKMIDNPFALTLNLKTPISDPDFAATANGTLNLGNISKVLKLQDMDLKGIFTAALKANGKMSYIDQEKYELFNIAGDLNLSDFVLKMNSLDYDVNVNKANLNFTSENVNVDAALALGESDLSLKGKLQHFIQYAMRGETIKGSLNVSSKKLNVTQLIGADSSSDTQSSEVTETTETTTETASESSSVAIPNNIDFALNVGVDEILYDAINLKNVKGVVNVKDAIAKIESLTANTMGGSVSINGEYNTQDTLNPAVDVDMNVKDMTISEVFTTVTTANKIAPILSDADGQFSLTMRFASNMDNTLSPVLNTVNAKGKFSSKDISIKNVKAFTALAEKTGIDLLKKPNLKDINIAFVVKDGRLNIDPFQTIISNTTFNFSGSSGLDQTLDYVANIQLPKNISKAIDLAFDMNIGGTFTNPKITFSASSLKEQVTEKVTEVIDKAKEKAIAAAKEQKEKLIAAAKTQKEKLVAAAQENSDKLVAKAQAEADKVTNPLKKAAAQAAVKAAKSQGDKLVSEAEKSGDKLVSEAEKQGDALVEAASK